MIDDLFHFNQTQSTAMAIPPRKEVKLKFVVLDVIWRMELGTPTVVIKIFLNN